MQETELLAGIAELVQEGNRIAYKAAGGEKEIKPLSIPRPKRVREVPVPAPVREQQPQSAPQKHSTTVAELKKMFPTVHYDKRN